MPLDVLRVNDAIHSWNSCRFLVDVEPFTGLVAVDTEETREVKVVYGARRDGTPLGTTSGKYTAKPFTAKFLTDQWEVIKKYLAIKGLGSYGDARFAFAIESSEEADIEVPVLILIANTCRVVGVKKGFEEGVEESLAEITIQPLNMIDNGDVLFSLARSIG